MDTYAKQYGNFTYTSDWNGFNVPSNIVRKFFTIFFDDLLIKEKHLFSTISPILSNHPNFYLIATHNANSLSHEIAHGYYYLDEKYQIEMNGLIESYQYKHEIMQCLTTKGYNEKVLFDEIQAYFATANSEYLFDRLKFKEIEVPSEFKTTFQAYDDKYSKQMS